jgi:L,D-peptidoglycan transpeptidase YkuD (ErfK/YbiS/YcfS/YnhG family)
MPTVSEIHVYGQAGRLTLGDKAYRCVVGAGGVVDADQKQEGDGATPAGSYALRQVHYRPDRLEAPSTKLPVRALTPDDGWGDDPKDANHYNRFVNLPYTSSHEQLWHADDHLYDVMGEIGYNDNPPVRGKGSAIFMHVARATYAPTAGCVALALPDLLEVLAQTGPDTRIIIHK